jgi:hypothetical protein
MKRWVRAITLASALGAAGCGGSDTPAKTCLTDQQICQFHAGVSTTIDVRNALGPPQVSQSVSNGGASIQQWVYICQQSAQAVDLVQFVFDGSGVLQGMTVSRSGQGTTPAPTCG